MPSPMGKPIWTGGPGKEGSGGANHFFQLLRYSHIFASAIREITEAKYLQDSTRHALSRSQFHLLKLIASNGVHHVGDVAGFLGVSAPAATKNIDKLERLGLVERLPSKGDRRATLLAASKQGRRLVRNYEKLKSERLAPVFRQFTRKEIEELTRLLQRFALSLIRQEKNGNGLCIRCAAYWDQQCPIQQSQNRCSFEAARAAHRSDTRRTVE